MNQVDLHFQACLRDSLISIDQGRGLLKPLRALIAMLAQSHGISLRGYNSFGVYTGNLLEELNAWSMLSDAERWYPGYEVLINSHRFGRALEDCETEIYKQFRSLVIFGCSNAACVQANLSESASPRSSIARRLLCKRRTLRYVDCYQHHSVCSIASR